MATEEVVWYYKKVFKWDWLEQFVTRGGKYEFGQFVFFFFLMGYDNNNKPYPARERMQFPSVDKLKEFVIKNRVVEILMSAWYPLEMSMGKTVVDAAQAASTKHALSQLGGAAQAATPVKDKWFDNKMLERPLILDFDINDMDRVRKAICECVGKMCCDTCWSVLVEETALPFLKMMLEDFCHFKEVMYVFSGRRGFHVHISDERVLAWTLQQRKDFMKQLMESEDACPPVFTDVFEKYISPQHHSDLPEVTAYMNEIFPMGFGGEQTIGEMLQYAKTKFPSGAQRRLEKVYHFALCPRFDPGFVKDITHLIKCPYTIHRETKNICVPLKPGFKPSEAVKYTTVLIAGGID